MHRYHNEAREMTVKAALDRPVPLPADPQQERVVLWKTFRSRGEALDFARNVLLEADQTLIGGHDHDSVGPFYWLGVQVADLAAWGNSQAIQLRDPFDADDPQGQGRGISI
ncbi:MAG: hypothetical protein ACOY5C_05165 [Pseudomonadota bacterium]|uniref:hypothetical protein n=1 Tax=Thermithiobacillus tepidarius TaxID=929 RepID=UPI0004193C8D|nr:hypothetical protein [Thermithiobacillus tepidarius]